MSQELPQFAKRPYDKVHQYAARAFKGGGPGTSLIALKTFDDGHYRAIFSADYFTLHEGATEPTKSQWNTLKKHLKRIDHRVFIFREYGETDCPPHSPHEKCYYIDFGFFAN